MRISAKGRYALASVVHMAQQQHSGESITLVSISERLGISKIYLEQVFSLLKRGELGLKKKQVGRGKARGPCHRDHFTGFARVGGSEVQCLHTSHRDADHGAEA